MLGKNNIRWAGYKKRNQRRILSFLIFFSLMGMASAEFCIDRYEDVDVNYFVGLNGDNIYLCDKVICDNPVNISCSDTGVDGSDISSIVYEDGIAYYTNYNTNSISAANLFTGTSLWSGALRYPMSAVVDGGKVYVTNHTMLKIFNKVNGATLYTVNMDSYIENATQKDDYKTGLPDANSIAVDEDYVYVISADKLLIFDKYGNYDSSINLNEAHPTWKHQGTGIVVMGDYLFVYHDHTKSVWNKNTKVLVSTGSVQSPTGYDVDAQQTFAYSGSLIYTSSDYSVNQYYNYKFNPSSVDILLDFGFGGSPNVPIGVVEACECSNADLMQLNKNGGILYATLFNSTQDVGISNATYYPLLDYVIDRNSLSYTAETITAQVNLISPGDFSSYNYGDTVEFCFEVSDSCEDNIYSYMVVETLTDEGEYGSSGTRCYDVELDESGYLSWYVQISDNHGNTVESDINYVYVGEENESVTGEGLDNIKYGNIIADVLYAKNSTYVTDGYVELQVDVGGEYYTEDIKFLTGKPIVFYNQEKGYDYRLYVSYVNGHNDEYSEPLHFYGALNNLTIAHYLSSETILNQKIIVKDENWNNLEDVQVQVAIDEGGSLPTKYSNASGEVTWLITDNYFGKVFTFSFIHDDYITSPQHFLEFEMNEDSETRYFQFNYNDIPQDNRSEYCSLTGFVTSNDTGSGLYNVGVEYFERCTYGECNNEYTTTLTDGEFYFNHKIPLHTNFQLRFDGQKVAHGDYLTGMLYCNESKNITQNIALIIQDDYTATSSYSYEVTVINGATNEPLRDVLVELVEESVYNTLTLNTNHDGYVKFRNIPSSNYWVLLSKEGYRDVILDYNRKGNIYERKDRIEMFDEDKDYYSVSGTFYREDNSGHKSVIINGYVTVSNTDGFQVKRTKTGVNGKYVLKNLEEGDYCIQASFNDTISKQECFDLNTDYNGVDFVVNTQQQDSLTELRNLIQFGINVLPSMIIITVFLMFINIMGKALNFD